MSEAIDALESKFGMVRNELFDRDGGNATADRRWAQNSRVMDDTVHDVLVREASSDLWKTQESMRLLQEEMTVNRAARAMLDGREEEFRRALGDETRRSSYPHRIMELAREHPAMPFPEPDPALRFDAWAHAGGYDEKQAARERTQEAADLLAHVDFCLRPAELSRVLQEGRT